MKTFYFIISLPRSGSTLLASILNSHSKIHVEHEDNAKPFPDRKFKNDMNLTYKIQKGLDGYLKSLLKGTNRDILVTSRYYHKKHIKSITDNLTDKGIVSFIILNRKHMWRTFFNAKGNANIVPLHRILYFMFCKKFVKDRYNFIEVNYHDIVKNPEEEIKKICFFLRVNFEAGMLNYQRFNHSNIGGNIKTKQFKGVVDKSKKERLSFQMVWGFIKYRFLARIYKRVPNIKSLR